MNNIGGGRTRGHAGPGRLCRGAFSRNVHYWWYRRAEGPPIRNEREALVRTARAVCDGMGGSRRYVARFRLQSDQGRARLFRMVFAKLQDSINMMRMARTSAFMLPDGGTQVAYKPVAMARHADPPVPLYELAVAPMIGGGGECSPLQIRVYESEPESNPQVCVAHRAEVKSIWERGRFDSPREVDVRIRAAQNAAIADAMDQYRAFMEI